MPHTTDITDYVRVSDLSKYIEAKFNIWFVNRDFKQYLTQISEGLETQQVSSITIPVHSVLSPQTKYSLQDEYRYIGMQAVFDEDPAILDDRKLRRTFRALILTNVQSKTKRHMSLDCQKPLVPTALKLPACRLDLMIFVQL